MWIISLISNLNLSLKKTITDKFIIQEPRERFTLRQEFPTHLPNVTYNLKDYGFNPVVRYF